MQAMAYYEVLQCRQWSTVKFQMFALSDYEVELFIKPMRFKLWSNLVAKKKNGETLVNLIQRPQ